MTSKDIEKLQIIATTKDGQHLLAISDDWAVIQVVAQFCQFAKLRNELFEQCSIKELIQED